MYRLQAPLSILVGMNTQENLIAEIAAELKLPAKQVGARPFLSFKTVTRSPSSLDTAKKQRRA